MDGLDAVLDQVVPQAAPPAAPSQDGFDAILDQTLNEKFSQTAGILRGNYQDGVNYNPDQEAKNHKTAKAINAPVDAVRNLPEEAKRQAALQDFNAEAVAKATPSTAQFLSNPENMRIAHDDLGFLTGFEVDSMMTKQVWDDVIAPTPARGWSQFVKGSGGVERWLGEMFGIDALVGRGKEMQQAGKDVEAQIAREHPLEEGSWSEASASALSSMYLQAPFMAMGLLAPTVTKATAATLGLMGTTVAGQTYGERREAGVGKAASSLSALWDGTVEIGTELAPTKIFFDMLKPLAKQTLGRFILQGVKYYGAEMIGESAATFLQDANEKIMGKPDQTMRERVDNFSQYMTSGEAMDNWKATLKSTFVQTSLMLGAGAGVNRIKQSRMEQTNTAQDALINTFIAAEQSRLSERSPESFADFAQGVGDRNGISTIYLQADSLVQAVINSGIPEAQIPAWAAQYGVAPEDLTTAMQTNGLVEMEYGKVAAGWRTDEAIKSLQTELMIHPDALPASRLEEGVKAEAEHFARLDALYQEDRARKISMDDVDAWEQAILDNPDLSRTVKPESLLPAVAWANTLATETGTPAIDHLNRLLAPKGVQAMKYADWQQGQETTPLMQSDQAEMGININDDAQPFTEQILSGEKTVETRNTPSLRPYVGKRVGIVKTGKGTPAMLVGYATIGEEVAYDSPEAFDAAFESHRVAADSPFYNGGRKYGYTVTDVERIEPRPVESRGIVSRKLGSSFAGMSDQAQAIADELNLTITEGAIAPTVLFSSRTWTPDEKGQIRELAASMGIEEEKVDKWMFDIDNAMARVLNDPSLDFIAEAADLYSALKPNSDPHYTVSLDFSTLCRKRYELMATIEAIQNLTGRALTKETWVEVRAMLDSRGYNVSCGACYVDSKRMEAGKFINKFIDAHPDEDPKQFLSQSGVDQLKRDNPELYAEFKKALGANNAKTPESRTDYHGEVRWYFTEGREQDMSATQLSGKAAWTTKENPERGKRRVEAMNKKSGLRWQSWSDFEVPHLMDAMQAILDMHMAGLMGHAYTKVPDFVLAMGKTGLMVNMSLIAKGTGLAEDGTLIFDTKEGMPFDVALKLRDAHEMTAGTIAIGISNDHIKALLADPRIDYVIPYHASGLSKEIAKKFNMDGWEDYTDTQSEDIGDFELFHEMIGKNHPKTVRAMLKVTDPAKWVGQELRGAKKRQKDITANPEKAKKDEQKKLQKKIDKLNDFKSSLAVKTADEIKTKALAEYRDDAKAAGLVGIDTTEYWDDTKSGPENSALYLAMAAERGIAPKFRGHEYSNGRTLADLTGEEGYWKLLIDRKMYDHSGKNIIQEPVKPEYDEQTIQDIYDRGAENPTPNSAVPEVVNEMAGKMGYTGPLFQEQQNPLGATVPGSPNLVTLFEKADKSTFLHESGHIFLNDLKYVAENLGVHTEIWAGVKEWLGVGEDGVLTEAMHEQFAEHFEVYLKNGRAPSIFLRDAFRKFKSWLTAIYDAATSKRSGQRAGVKVSPEIAELFDRMLATEQEIQAARESSALIAMLSDKELSEAGDGTAQIEAYRKIVQQAEESARERRDKYKLMGLPERQAAWKKQAAAEVKAIPIYAAVDAIKAAGGVTRASIEQQFGKMPDNPSLYRNAGLNVNVAVAEHTNYENAAAFVEDLRNSTPRQVWIDKRVAELETIHDMAQDTQEAIRTASLRRMMEVESQWLAKKAVNKAALPRETLRKWAEGKVAGMAPKQIRAISKLLSESKQHRQKAILAAKQGNWEVALKENEQARMTEALIAESYRAMKGLDKVQANWKKIAKWTNDNKSVKVGEDFRDQINRILTQYGIAVRAFDPNATNLHAFVAGLAEGDLDGIGTALPEWIGAQVWDAKNMTWGQIQELNSALKFLYGHGREEVEGRKLTNGQRVKDYALQIIARMAGLKNLPDLKSNATRSGKIIQGIQRGYLKFFANTAILRFIAKRADGYGKGIGPAEQTVQNIINGMARVNDTWEAMQKLIEPELKILFKDGQAIYSDIPIPAVMKKKGEVWTKEKVVTAMLNTGNDGNLQRLMDGYELDKQTIDLMAGKLTKAEWQAIQNIWNGVNTLWPQIAAVHERLNFFRPAKIDPRPMQIQAADGPIDLEGGYYPIAYDKDKSRKAREHGEKNDILDKQEMILQKPIPKAGATKARSATVTRPLHLSLAVLGQHFTDMLKYIHLSEAVRDADRVFQNKDLLAQMENVFGQDMVDMIRPTLTNVLRPAPSDLGIFEKSRILMSIYYMGYNAWTALQNVTGVFPMIHKAGAANYLNGIKHVISNPLAAHKAMLEASAYMRLRENNIERDMKKQLRDFNTAGVEINGKRYTYDDVKSLGFAGIRLIDGIVALPAWWGVYNAQIEEHGDVQKAVEAADAAVNQALGSGLAIDHTGFGRHPFFSLLAPFMSFASTQQEVLATTNEARRQGRISNSDFLYAHLMTWLAPAILSTFLQGALMYGIAGSLGGGDDKRKKKGLSDYMTDMISYRLMGVPYVRDLYNWVIQGYEKKAPVTSARMISTEGWKMAGQFAYRVGNLDGSEKTTKAMMWAAAELVSLVSGIPATRIYERWMKGQKDIESGRGWWGNHFIPQEKKKQ